MGLTILWQDFIIFLKFADISLIYLKFDSSTVQLMIFGRKSNPIQLASNTEQMDW
jgi:hypothetical protein